MIRKIISLTLCFLLLAGVVSGCGGDSDGGQTETEAISVVVTIFPEYDWVREIVGEAGDHVVLTMLLDNGVDLHSYQPTAADIVRISTCDLFLYVGGESDEWVEDALAEAANEDMVVISLLDVLGDSAKEEELVEGMEAEEEKADEEPEYDEHVWLSLKNAQVLCQYISDRLCEIDQENSETYAANAAAYIEKLSVLDGEYADAVSGAARTTLLFGDRFPFRYLADDYGLTYYAAFAGCSAETEASFETIAFLAGKVDELGLTTVLTIEGSDQKIAETIVSAAASEDVQILSLDSMQSTTAADAEKGGDLSLHYGEQPGRVGPGAELGGQSHVFAHLSKPVTGV